MGVQKWRRMSYSMSRFRLSFRIVNRSSLVDAITDALVWRKALAPDRVARETDFSCRFSLGTRFLICNKLNNIGTKLWAEHRHDKSHIIWQSWRARYHLATCRDHSVRPNIVNTLFYCGCFVPSHLSLQCCLLLFKEVYWVLFMFK